MPRHSSSSVRVSYPKFDLKTLVSVLRERLPLLEARLPLVRAVLFGSWARGSHTAASDVDLLIVYRGVEREDAFALVKTALALPGLEPHVYTVGEAQANHARLERMLTGGVVLYSREEPS